MKFEQGLLIEQNFIKWLGPLYNVYVTISVYYVTSVQRSVRKRGSERTEREKALSRLRSRPQPGRAERELWEFYKKIASISSWERERKPHSTCRGLNPLTPTWVTTCTWRDFPAPKRWSREMGKRWTLCGLSTLPFYRSSWKGEPMTWGAPPYVLFRPSSRCSSRPKSC